MSDQYAELQSAAAIGPRDLNVLAITLDATSRAKDLWSVDLAGVSYTKGGRLFLDLSANVKWWFRLSATASTVDEAAIDLAASAITLRATAGVEVQALQPVTILIDRLVDRYLVVKGSAAGELRGFVSSPLKGDSA